MLHDYEFIFPKVLDTMRDMNSKGVTDKKALSVEMGKKAELKKYMKRVMPFVAFMQDKVESVGVSALDTSLPWDEMEVLEKNKVGFIYTLHMFYLFPFKVIFHKEIRFVVVP